MDLTKYPAEFVKQAKELGVEIVKPASKEGIRKVALGAIGAGAISPIYSKGFDYLWEKTQFQNPYIKAGAKISIPLVLSVIALKTKFPGGNLICGSLVGVGIVEIIKALFSGLSGKLPALPNNSNNSNETLSVYVPETNNFYTK